MKILFKNTTKYTKKFYDIFLEFHNKKYGFYYSLYNIIIISLFLFCIILQVQYNYYSIAIFTCFVLTAFILWRFLHPIHDVSKEYKSDKFKDEQSFTFKFYEKFFTCENKTEISKIKYSKLHKVYETNKFFYLYIDRNHSFLMDKSKFLQNNPSEFSTFIKRKCLLRFRNCIKEKSK